MDTNASTPIEGWNVPTLYAHLSAIIVESDRRYEQRFVAQEQAVVVALEAVNKEFHEHLAQARLEAKTALEANERALVAALAATEKAIDKSEIATEKRFESVNEFRQQLSDIISQFPRKIEVDQKFDSVVDKIDLIREGMARVHSRLDLTEGSRAGGREAVTERRESNAALYALGGFIAVIISILGTILALKP